MQRLICAALVLALVTLLPRSGVAAETAFELHDGDRVALIGGTFVEREQSYSYIETLFHGRWPQRKFTFRNLGWSGDNVFGASRGYFEGSDAGFARLTKTVHELKPTVIFIGYGMTESFEGEAGLPAFRSGLEKLLDMLKDLNARETVLIGPIQHEKLGPPLPDPAEHNKWLRAYADAMNELATRRGFRFVDLYDLTKRGEGLAALTDNGIHLTHAGYSKAATAILEKLGVDQPRWDANAERIRLMAIRKNIQFFNQWRPANETYIFGFRAYEQGKNAAEMPQFTRPIEALEAEIFLAARSPEQTPRQVPLEVDGALPPPPDPELERRSFNVCEGFEVNLWAADPLLAKPIQMNWDAQGRLWVASSSMYPQIKPGETLTDKVIVLEDTDADGKADKSTVFADGLLIPTGIEPDGTSAAYVANSTELIHLKDTDNDGKADQRRIVLSGFGTEDTHHILHTLRWGHDGRLWMNQSIYIHSHVETPWGTKRLMGSGIWRFRPESLEFDIFARGMVNPWGHAFDRFGQSFSTDGAGGEGIYYTFPGSAFQTAKSWDGIADMERIMKGMNPGSPKYCGLEIVSGRHLPDDWQGNAVTNDFRANRVVRYQIVDENGTFVSKQMPDVITSKDVSFRPIDVKMGPDGAIYIADWFNPIINHGEVDFRDKRRDKTHGRIWRITAKGRPLVEKPEFNHAKPAEIVAQLQSPEGWTRHQARLVLRTFEPRYAIPPLAEWVSKLDPKDKQYDEWRLEALWTYQTFNLPSPALLEALLTSSTPQVRAAATRVVPDWAIWLPNVMELLAARVADEHVRVRLEAVRALARLGTPAAFELAMTALDRPMDSHIEYALWTTANEMKSIWLPAFQAGKVRFGGNAKHVAYALQAVKAREALDVLVKQLQAGQVPAENRAGVFDLIASIGSEDHAKALFDIATAPGCDDKTAAEAFTSLRKGLRERNLFPKGADAGKLARVIAGELPDELRVAAIRLVGAWPQSGLVDELKMSASLKATPQAVWKAAIESLAERGTEQAAFIREFDAAAMPFENRAVAIAALSTLDLADAAKRAAALLADAPTGADPASLMTAFLQREGGGDALAAALQGKNLNADIAKLGLRYVNATGRETPALTARLREAAGLGAGPQRLTPEQMAATVKEVQEKGDAARGELVFRRADASCFQCHAIGGAGGSLAPDLRAIGASSPVDYLIDSLIDPNKAVKDGYQSTVIATKNGEVFSGIKISQDDKQIILRDATHDAIPIPLASVRKERAGGSLMPASLVDSLTRGEFLDLVKFMSELGKPGPYGPDNARLVRRWRAFDLGSSAGLSNSTPARSNLLPAYSLVSGLLPLDAIAPGAKHSVGLARAEIDVTTPGRIGLHLGNVKGLELWIDDKPVEAKPLIEIDLPRGVHTLEIKVDIPQRGGEGLRVEIKDLPGSSGHAQPVGGR